MVLDVRGLTLIADYFIICTGTSRQHISAISEKVHDRLREELNLRSRQEGDEESLWVVLDYGDVVLHIFEQERRQFYDLERLWSNATKTIWMAERKERTPADQIVN